MTDRKVKDAREFGRVAVLMGGWAAEREVSLRSGSAVLAALKSRDVDAYGIDLTRDNVGDVIRGDFDRAFIALHGRGGEDGVIQGMLDALGIPYTGSGVLGSALAMDKLRSKRLWVGAGLSTPAFTVLAAQADLQRALDEVGLPMIVKPATEGSSIGMSKVKRAEDLPAAWEAARGYGCEVFAERWVQGAEYTAGIIGDQSLPLIRLETPREFYDYTAKYHSNDTRYYCPAGLSSSDEAALRALARRAFDALDCSGWGRIDLLCDASGAPWLIEANTVPGMTDHSLVPMAARAAGLTMEDLVWRILEGSFGRDQSAE
ncbi:MAG: D-alanine--D-alanine ligase [Chromatiales bacterium]|jgi:D-alanine-D-alanine ligase|nr:D-alanine--D-alanine ligase [Chromatiales bacterium]